MKKRKTPFICRTVVKRVIHESGMKSSRELENALDEIIESQISQACTVAINQNKKVLRREMLTTLFT